MVKNHLVLFLILIGYNIGQSQKIDTLIRVDNHQLHFEIIKGNDTPILFEAGNGDDGSVWKPLLKEIHKATGATLITYDRAGLGKSGIDTTTVSFKREILNLNKALAKLGYGKRYFLVAHSFGGFYASEFAQNNKGKIKGAVFIDTATPCIFTKVWASSYKKNLPDNVWAMLMIKRKGLFYVLKNFPSIMQYMATRYISNTIPLTLIVAENAPNANTLKTEEERINWVKCLKAFGNAENHNYVLAKNTDHKVWEKDPKTVIEEITRLYLKVYR